MAQPVIFMLRFLLIPLSSIFFLDIAPLDMYYSYYYKMVFFGLNGKGGIV